METPLFSGIYNDRWSNSNKIGCLVTSSIQTKLTYSENVFQVILRKQMKSNSNVVLPNVIFVVVYFRQWQE